MLAGQMSNEDEDQVEDELEALEREVQGPVVLPNAPEAPPALSEDEKRQRARERAKARAEANAKTKEGEQAAMLAA